MENSNGIPKDTTALEQQYMQLLEKRIAQLEELVSKTSIEAGKDASKDEASKTVGANGVGPDANDSGPKDAATTDESSKQDKAGAQVEKKDSDAKAGAENENTAKETDSKEKELTQRVQNITCTYDENDETYSPLSEAKLKSTKVEDESAVKEVTSAATFRRVVDENSPKRVVNEVIEIASAELKRLYYELTVSSSSTADLDSDEPLELESPFVNFAWRWNEFEAACEVQEGDSEERTAARGDLKELMSMVRKSRLEDLFKARDTALSNKTIRYEYLWILFRPGVKVYTKTALDDIQMLEVKNCDLPPVGKHQITRDEFDVSCAGFDWDGTKFVSTEYMLTITKDKNKEQGQADMAIENLEVCPVSFYRSLGSLDLVQRGKKFWEICDTNASSFQYNYQGAVLTTKPSQAGLPHMLSQTSRDDETMSTISGDETRFPTVSRKEYRGKIIIDAFSFVRAQDDVELPLGDLKGREYRDFDCTCKSCSESLVVDWQRKFRPNASARQRYEAFKDDDQRLAMCPPRVLGYALKTKLWAQFRVSGCKPQTNEDVEGKDYFKTQLQLDDQYKKLLMAFVNNHQSTRTSSTSAKYDEAGIPKSLDVIEGKGKGLAILLHGPPGVGKTLTAETIALASGRPLLGVSVAEIGTKAAEAESRLNVWFAIAARWGAILLVDEADVFLEERISTDNPERNMLVSVLLRCLEYYEGIIFLTTNRIRSIDVAVQSRMHLAVQYKRLTQKQKAAIYKNLLDKVRDDMIKGSRSSMYRDISEYLCRRNEMNGRQIRNIVSAALALAAERSSISDGENGADFKLSFSDLRRVHETTADFLESLKDTTKKARARNEAAEDSEDD